MGSKSRGPCCGDTKKAQSRSHWNLPWRTCTYRRFNCSSWRLP